MEDNNNPLVSVIVATFNSSSTIIETLDSIFHQSYPNVELIVTDDKSTDDTCSLVKRWISEKSNRFHKCILCETLVNTGVSGNFNRGLSLAEGEWIKPFGGDDILFPEYLEKVLSCGKNVDMVATQLYLFKNDKKILEKGTDLSFINRCTSNKVAKYYARIHPFLNVPTLIIKRSVYDRIGFYDERSPFFEDVPFIMSFFKAKLKAFFLDEVLVWYRVGGMSHQVDFEKAFSGNKKLLDVCKLCIYPNLSWYNPIDFLVMIDQLVWSTAIRYKLVLLYKFYCSRYNLLKNINIKLSTYKLNN